MTESKKKLRKKNPVIKMLTTKPLEYIKGSTKALSMHIEKSARERIHDDGAFLRAALRSVRPTETSRGDTVEDAPAEHAVSSEQLNKK